VNWPSITFEYGPFPRPRLDYDLFGFELSRYGRISADGRALTLPPEYIHLDQVGYLFFVLGLQIFTISPLIIHLHFRNRLKTFLFHHTPSGCSAD